jgi:hypothetical protein
MAAYLSGAVDNLGEFLIDLFAGDKSLDSESKSSESSQTTRSHILVNLRNQEDIRLLTVIFVLQPLEQRYFLEICLVSFKLGFSKIMQASTHTRVGI